jgi:hypothetical protein
LESEFGNILGTYRSLADAVDAFGREIASGGSVEDWSVIHWSGDSLHVDLSGQDLYSPSETNEQFTALVYYSSARADPTKKITADAATDVLLVGTAGVLTTAAA